MFVIIWFVVWIILTLGVFVLVELRELISLKVTLFSLLLFVFWTLGVPIIFLEL